MPHTRHILHHTDPLHAAQGLAIFDGYLVTCLNGGVHLFQVQQTIGTAHFIHLAIDARSYDGGLARKTEVLQIVNALLRFFIVANQGTAFHRVVHLRGVETQCGHIARIQDGLSVHLHAEGMGGIIDDLQAILVCYLLNAFRVAGLAIDVYGHNGRGLGSDGCLDLVRVDVAGFRVDVHEHRLDAVPPQGMGGGHEAVGRGDDLARDAQGLQGAHQGKRAVGEQADVGHFQVLAQGLLQFLVIMTIVGQPFTIPYILQVRHEIIQRRKQR